MGYIWAVTPLLLLCGKHLAVNSEAVCYPGCICSIQFDCSRLEENLTLTEIPVDMNKYGNFYRINLANNRIVAIRSLDLAGQTATELLYFQNNELTAIEENSFIDMTHLKVLELSNNPQVFMNTNLSMLLNVFTGLSSLRSLFLTNTGIRSLSQEIFAPLTSLTFLDISDNINLRHLPANLFMMVPKLHGLYMQNLIYLSHLPTDIFQPLTRLSILVLSNNSLAEFPTEQLRFVRSSLASLTFNHNTKIKALHSGSLYGFHALQGLDLIGLTPLEHISSAAFGDLPRLDRLKIQGCPSLTHISADAFRNLNTREPTYGVYKMFEVRLSGNSLRSVDARMLDWSTIQVIDLEDNPWSCDCHLVWILNVSHNIPTYRRKNLRCAQPVRLEGRSVVNVSREEMRCDPSPELTNEDSSHMVTLVIIVVIVTGIAAVIAVMLLWRCLNPVFLARTRVTTVTPTPTPPSPPRHSSCSRGGDTRLAHAPTLILFKTFIRRNDIKSNVLPESETCLPAV